MTEHDTGKEMNSGDVRVKSVFSFFKSSMIILPVAEYCSMS